ncbi:MAG: hypothetical protein RLZZ546_2060, partial [Bacteroidota bacterium]
MYKISYIVIFYIFFSKINYAQVTFSIYESKNKEPLNEVYAIDINGRILGESNDLGKITLSEKTNTVVFHKEGYEETICNLQPNIINQTIYLNAKNLSIKEVVIISDQIKRKEAINKIDLHLRPINNAQEILRMVPGLFIGQHAGGGKAEQIFLRGFDVDHGTDVQISVDGLPVNIVSHAHGQGYADLHFVIPELIDQVDFDKGAYLAEKGNFNTAGWVNLKLKNQLASNVFKAEIGQYDSYRIFSGVNLIQDAQKSLNSAYVAGEYHYSNGYFDAPQNFYRLNVI